MTTMSSIHRCRPLVSMILSISLTPVDIERNSLNVDAEAEGMLHNVMMMVMMMMMMMRGNVKQNPKSGNLESFLVTRC